MFLDKSDAVLDLLHRIWLHTVVCMTDRNGQFIGRNAKVLPFDTVSHEAAVTGGIAVHRARPDSRIVVLQRNAELRQRHRADIRRNAISLCCVRVMHHPVLNHHSASVNCRHFHRSPDQIRKSIHDLAHHIFIEKHHLLSKLLIVSAIGIGPEHPRHGFAHIDHNDAERRVRDAKL